LLPLVLPLGIVAAQFDALYRSVANTNIRDGMSRRTVRDLVALRALVLTKIIPTAPDDCVLNELKKTDGQPDGVSIDNLVFMLQIATNNVAGLLHWIAVEFAQNQDWQERLRQDPDSEALRADFVLETLRLHQSEYLYRKVIEDIQFEGWTIPKGWRVRVCVAESHRDATHFPNPESFRKRSMSKATAGQFSPFGIDRHACNGAGITLIIASAVMNELSSYPYLYASNTAPLHRDFRHWSHWRPNPSMTVRFDAEAP
jgi:cytochrome P450